MGIPPSNKTGTNPELGIFGLLSDSKALGGDLSESVSGWWGGRIDSGAWIGRWLIMVEMFDWSGYSFLMWVGWAVCPDYDVLL